ncbi:MAG: hypothetical protein LBP62_06200 [Clostridiales bacterium]|jgi:hypothetical protein|nr:hypothetical protein [Clostridiales bacterium]
MKKYVIEMEDVKLEDIYAIDLALENCESIRVYRNEILEINFELDDNLVIGTSCIERRIKSGYIKLRIDEKTKRRNNDVYIHDDNGEQVKKPYKKKIEDRLIELCNICYIVITVVDIYWEENLDVPYEEECIEDDEGYVVNDRIIVCPSAKMDADGNLIILLGELSEFEPQEWTDNDGE